jgi:hypothetical protein
MTRKEKQGLQGCRSEAGHATRFQAAMRMGVRQ